MPKTATPRKPETVSRKLAETRNTSKNRSLSSLLGIGDNEKRLATDLGSGLNDVIGRGTIAGLLGLPGDLGGAAENGLRSLLGLPQVVPYGGSEHIGQKLEQAGLVSDVRRPKTELLASLISPAQAATAGYKAPQMARAGVKALDNLSAPRTMGRQQGAIENLWHGSPHTFDRFDLSKIGTGEGAQAYGHGAYLAESPTIAKTYQAKVSAMQGADKPTIDGSPINWDDPIQTAAFEVSRHNGDRAAAADFYERTFSRNSPVPDIIRSGDELPQVDMPGNIYQTRLAWPDAREATDPLSPDHFLHWDKPLSEQSPMVQKSLNEKWAELNSARQANGLPPATGDDFHRHLEEVAAEQADAIGSDMPTRVTARDYMASQGIPGIRYLDGGSRGAGAGSHNYVVFDDKLIDIVSRNGQPVGNLGKMVAPQDEALRVAQANAAKPVSEGGLGLRPDNTPEERAAAMGFDIPVYHATDQNFTAFDPLKRGTTSDSGWYGDADYTAPSPDYAARFIEKPIDGFVSGVAYKDGGNIMPLLARAENPYDWRANEPMGRGLFQNDRRASIDKRKELQGMGYDSVAVNNSKIFLDDGQDLSNEQWDILTSASPMLKSIGKQEVENLIRANNYDFRDFARSYGIDAASAMPQKSDMVELATFNPSQIRSRFAAFDPMRKDSSDLLAGLAPLGAVPWLYGGEE